MKWILTQDKLPDKECNEIFCTIKDRRDISTTTIEKYYPKKITIYKDCSCFVQGEGFGRLVADEDYMYFSEQHPVAWSYVPDFDSDEWLKLSDCSIKDEPCKVIVIRETNGQKYIDYAYYNASTFKVVNYELDKHECVNDVVGWMRYPKPYLVKKPKVEDLRRKLGIKNQEHFVKTVDASGKPLLFKELENKAKEIPILKKICVYELESENERFYNYEIEIIDKDSKPKDYFNGCTDFEIQGRKLTKGKFLDSNVFSKILSGNYAIINGIIYPRDEAISIFGNDEVDIKIMEWLNSIQLKDYLCPSRYRDPVSEKVKELFKKRFEYD